MIDGKTNIIGTWNGTIDDLVRPFLTGGDIIRARRIAPMYIKYCKMFGIRTDIAFAQMCHETGKLTFKGIAKPEWNNFAGLGITGAGAKQTFADEDLGVIAHIAHLAWYVYPDHVHSLCSIKFDPRHFGNTHYKYNGDTTIGNLSGRWAYPGKYKQPDGSWITYDMKIAKYANIINNEKKEKPVVVIPETAIMDELEVVKPLLQKGDKGNEVKKLQCYLTSVGFSLVADGDFGAKTERQVKAYQKSKGLKETGIIDEELKKLMNNFVVVEPEKLDIIVQMGHIPRTKGATGTYREQEFTQKLGDAMEPLLKKSGLSYRIMGADNWLSPEPNKSKIFFAIHGDGSKNKKAGGYSLGFKIDSDEKFKERLAISYGKLCGLRRRSDNYTAGLRKYYSWRDDLKRKPHVVADYYALLEHCFMTNEKERTWLFNNIEKIAEHHINLIIKFLKEN